MANLRQKNNSLFIEVFNNTFQYKISDLDTTIDADAITKIDLNHLVEEIITTPCVVNRWGNILADVKVELQIKELQFDTFCARKKAEIRSKAAADGKKTTISEVDDTLSLEEEYIEKKTELIKLQGVVEVVNSTFWALKEKSSNLNKLSLTIVREDLENIQTVSFNGVQLKKRKNRIQEEE